MTALPKSAFLLLLLPATLMAAKLEPMTNEQYRKLYEQHQAEKKKDEERKAREKKEEMERTTEIEVRQKNPEKEEEQKKAGDLKYGDAGVLEPGGTMLMSYSVTDKPAGANVSASIFQLGVSPSINWFVLDQFYLLASPTLTYANATTTTGASSASASVTGVGGALGLGGIFYLAEKVYPYVEMSGNYTYYSGSVVSGVTSGTGTGKAFALNFGAGLKIGVLANGLFKVGFQVTRNFALEAGDLGSTSFYLLSGYSLWF